MPAAAQVCSGVAETHRAEAANSQSCWEPRVGRSRRGSRPKEELDEERAKAAKIAASIAASPKKRAADRREEAKTPRTRYSVDGAPMAKTPQRDRRKSTGSESWAPKLTSSQSQDAPFSKTPLRGRQGNASLHLGDCSSAQAQPQARCSSAQAQPQAIGAASSWMASTAPKQWNVAELERQMMRRCRSGLAVHWEQSSGASSRSRTSSHLPSHRSSRAGSPTSMAPATVPQPVGLVQASVGNMQVNTSPLSTMPFGGHSLQVGGTVNMQAMHMMAPNGMLRSASVPPMPLPMPQSMPSMQAAPMQVPPAPGLQSAPMQMPPAPGLPLPMPQPQLLPSQMPPQLYPQAMHHAVQQAPAPQVAQANAMIQQPREAVAPPAQPDLQSEAMIAELRKKLEKAEADNTHLVAANESLHNGLRQLRAAASPEVIEALKFQQKPAMPGAIYVNQGLQQSWSSSAVRDIHTGGAAPLWKQARRNSRYLIIDPRTGEEVSAPKIRKQPEDEGVRESRPSICEVFDMSAVDDDQVTEMEEVSPRKSSKAVNSTTANQTLGGLILEHTFGHAWDWPLSRQEKKERVLMINQCQLISEIQELQENLAEAQYGGLLMTPRSKDGDEDCEGFGDCDVQES